MANASQVVKHPGGSMSAPLRSLRLRVVLVDGEYTPVVLSGGRWLKANWDRTLAPERCCIEIDADDPSRGSVAAARDPHEALLGLPARLGGNAELGLRRASAPPIAEIGIQEMREALENMRRNLSEHWQGMESCAYPQWGRSSSQEPDAAQAWRDRHGNTEHILNVYKKKMDHYAEIGQEATHFVYFLGK
ncbi:MAG: hypothetical protein MO847_07310 [Candidatus Protistobacter heckmanni]|nr:hypothetical protein [Candidatus Protistobacter heckmanni]